VDPHARTLLYRRVDVVARTGGTMRHTLRRVAQAGLAAALGTTVLLGGASAAQAGVISKYYQSYPTYERCQDAGPVAMRLKKADGWQCLEITPNRRYDLYLKYYT
jgi:hypothetical protein